MRRLLLLLLAILGGGLPAADLLPTAPTAVVELNGSFRGERFWMRLNLPDARFGNQRMLELLYTPPKPVEIAGAVLVDCPFLLLDERLRLVAWNGRDTTQRVLPTATGYAITRALEKATEDGKDTAPDSEERTTAMPRGWDERLVPLMLALAWRSGSAGEIPVADLFGPLGAISSVTWQDGQVVIAGRPHRATADTAGRLARLDDAAGTAVLTIAAWKQP